VQEGKSVVSLATGQAATLVVNQTPFYAESGGQTGDHGVIKTAEGATFRVTDTLKRVGDLFVHVGLVESGAFKTGDAVALTVDNSRRGGNRQHHSATHLLHEALRTRLGTHVAQKGSMVEPGRLRFDFSHTKPMNADDIAFVEAMANDIVLQNDAVTTRLMTVDDAVAEGAMALFGEKYGDEVQVVSMGRNPEGHAKASYSLELCGGTHVRRTGDIGLIKVISESAVAAGVRRMEALAGTAARAYLDEQDKRVSTLADALKTSPAQLVERVQNLMDERKSLEKELRDVKKAMALASSIATVEAVGGVSLSHRIIKDLDAQDLKPLTLQDLKVLGSGVVVNITVSAAGTASIVTGVTPDLIGRYDAVALVKFAAAVVGGKGGGGKPDMAQAGGPDGAHAAQAIAAVKAALV
jgi:alanyl-tRNA synthetase